MQISYKSLSSDSFNIEFKLVKSDQSNFVAQQGDVKYKSRIKKAFIFAQRTYPTLQEHMLEPISINQTDDAGIVTALYRNMDIARAEDFLKNSNSLWQYVIGKRMGRVLNLLHSCELTQKDELRARHHHDRMVKNFHAYLNDRRMRFLNDGELIEAIEPRLDNFTSKKKVLLMGVAGLQNIFLTHDATVVIKPTYNFAIGDYAEDLASITNECAQSYPLFVGGVLDGYFGAKIPSQFYVNYALFTAMNVINRGYAQISRSIKLNDGSSFEIFRAYISKIDFLKEQFSGYKKPIPQFLMTEQLQQVRQKALSRAL